MLFAVGRFAGVVALSWLILFVLLDLLPNADGDVLAVQFPADRLAVTLPLVLMAGILALLLGAGISLLAARIGGAADRLLGGLATVLSHLPPFWLGLLLALLLAGVLPAGGFMPWSAGPLQALASLVLPALALGLPHAGQFAIRLRGAFGPEVEEAEIRALAHRRHDAGAGPLEYRWNRALPNLPQLAGRLLATVLVGAVVVENVFYLPGLGRQVLGAALAHDLPALRASLFLLVAIAALLMLLGTLGRLAVEWKVGGGAMSATRPTARAAAGRERHRACCDHRAAGADLAGVDAAWRGARQHHSAGRTGRRALAGYRPDRARRGVGADVGDADEPAARLVRDTGQPGGRHSAGRAAGGPARDRGRRGSWC